MEKVQLSIQAFLDALPDAEKPRVPSGRLTQKTLASLGLLDQFLTWRREQLRLYNAAANANPRTDSDRERNRVNQQVSRARRAKKADTREEALVYAMPRWTNGPGPVPRKPRQYDEASLDQGIRTRLLDKITKTSFREDNHRRKAISSGQSMVFGTVYSSRLNKYTVSSQSHRNPVLFRLLQELAATEVPTFSYTTIVVNKNVVTNPHVDQYNVGPTLILGIGDFNGGALVVQKQTFDISNHKWLYFWGKDEHYNTPIKKGGDKITITLFTLLPPYAPNSPSTHQRIRQMR